MSDVAGKQLEVQIKDDGSVLYDLRKKINFKGFSVEATADELKLSTDAPMRPQITSPSNGAVDVNVLTRISASAYYHIHGIPIGGSHWQIATDANFTQIVMDRTQYSGDYQTVVTSDENGAILSPAIKFYVRVRYFDVRDTYSQWSDPISFTTISVPAISVILEPVILSPAQNGTLPVGTMYIRLSDPEIIGSTLSVNQIEIQVSSTPQFESGDLYKTYLVSHPYFHYEKDPALEQIASPFFIRARQKDTVNGAASPWSNHIAVNISKYYNGDVIGLRHHVFGSEFVKFGSESAENAGKKWSRAYQISINENGEPVAIPENWYDSNAIFAGIHPVQITDALGTVQDMVFIPPFFVKAHTNVVKPFGKDYDTNVAQYDTGQYVSIDTDQKMIDNVFPTADEKIIDIWISPVKKDDTWYLHPMFQPSPAGIFVGAAVASMEDNKWMSRIGRSASKQPSDVTCVTGAAYFENVMSTWNTNEYSFHHYNAATRAGLHLLMAMYYRSIKLYEIFLGKTGLGNDLNSANWKGIYSIVNHVNDTYTKNTYGNYEYAFYNQSFICRGADLGKVINIHNLEDPLDPVTIGISKSHIAARGWWDPDCVEDIITGGHEDLLGYPIEIAFVPKLASYGGPVRKANYQTGFTLEKYGQALAWGNVRLSYPDLITEAMAMFIHPTMGGFMSTNDSQPVYWRPIAYIK